MKLLKKIAALAASAVIFAAASVSAFADYTYSLEDNTLVSDLQYDEAEINGTEGVFVKSDLQAAETDDAISIRFSVFNEYLETAFWDDPNIVVSVDVMLETEGVDVMAFIAGFDRAWKWINPSTYYTLTPNEWVTVSETGAHFQEVWSERGPNQFMFQVRSNWDAGAQGYVKVRVKDFRITGGDGTTTVISPDPVAEEETQPVATDTEQTESTTTASEAQPAESDSQPVESESTPEVTEAATTAATTIVTAATENTAPSMDQIVLERPDAEKDTAIVIIVVIVVAVVVVAAIVVGYLVYKKKMFY
ncbi:MAG: hypothetical protein ACI4Q4_07840 [Oscillospiraceae bacterium]